MNSLGICNSYHLVHDLASSKNKDEKHGRITLIMRAAIAAIQTLALAAVGLSIASFILLPPLLPAVCLTVSLVALGILFFSDTNSYARFFFLAMYPHNHEKKCLQRAERLPLKEIPIVFVHGFSHNSSGGCLLERSLKAKGHSSIFSVNLCKNQLFNPRHSIKDFSATLDKKLLKIKEKTGHDRVMIVAHSMGGIVASYYATRKESKRNVNVERVITVASPMRGTKDTNSLLGKLVSKISPCAREMSYKSDFVTKLSKKITECTTTHFYHIGSRDDKTIKPYKTALNCPSKKDIDKLNPYRFRLLQGIGHLELLWRDEVYDAITEFLHDTPSSHQPLSPTSEQA